ncbi:iron donor protein CyaY [Thaumasiovibrio subtropicus]|uniref:iron donor protein CyaY n=1 Tax=Thaumasiovibrio subtropicus TaxID=1891207 RepID=UPI000B34DEB0|nr:iron donor protein CyaY [Thaumasiovibrio subtropicus]
MNTTEFHTLADELFNAIEEGINESGADIEYETTGNVLTLEFEDRSQIVINRQEPMKEIWLASKTGGYHFQFNGSEWICSRSGREFTTMVKEECSLHAGEAVEW